MSKLEEMMDAAFKSASQIVAEGQELMAIFLAEDAEGKRMVIGAPWENNEQKQQTFTVLRSLFAEKNVVRYVNVVEAWCVEGSNEEDLKKVIPSESPNRIEVVMISGVDRATGSKVRPYLLKRDKERPYLVEMPDWQKGHFDGQMVNLIKKAN